MLKSDSRIERGEGSVSSEGNHGNWLTNIFHRGGDKDKGENIVDQNPLGIPITAPPPAPYTHAYGTLNSARLSNQHICRFTSRAYDWRIHLPQSDGLGGRNHTKVGRQLHEYCAREYCRSRSESYHAFPSHQIQERNASTPHHHTLQVSLYADTSYTMCVSGRIYLQS